MRYGWGLALGIAGAVWVSSAFSQEGYRPGQTFGERPTPTPAQPVFYRQTVPASTPYPVVTPRPTVKPAESALYNISKPTPIAKSRVEPVRSPAKAKSVEAKESPAVVKTEVPVVKAKASGTPEPINNIVINSRKTGKNWVALTYDDGPNPSYTRDFADFLVAENIPATFFLCGNMVKEYPQIAKHLSDKGFELANHSYSHPSLNKLSTEKITEQLQDTHDLIKEATGQDVTLMRPPYGAHNEAVRKVCEKMGYKIINWNVDTEDWKKRSVAQMVSTIMKKTGDGSIILMHDRKHGGVDTVKETTRQVVEKLRAEGYTFVTVGQLLSDTDSRPAVNAPVVQDAVGTSTLAVQPIVGITGSEAPSATPIPAATPTLLPGI